LQPGAVRTARIERMPPSCRCSRGAVRSRCMAIGGLAGTALDRQTAWAAAESASRTAHHSAAGVWDEVPENVTSPAPGCRCVRHPRVQFRWVAPRSSLPLAGVHTWTCQLLCIGPVLEQRRTARGAGGPHGLASGARCELAPVWDLPLGSERAPSPGGHRTGWEPCDVSRTRCAHSQIKHAPRLVTELGCACQPQHRQPVRLATLAGR
jgi:hypothetical protein